MPPTDNFTHFAIATVTICIPSYLLIFSLNSDTWQDRYKATFHWIREFLAHPFSGHRTKSESPRNWWSRLWEPKSEPTMQKRRQSRSLTAYEDLALRTKKLAVPVGQRETQRPSFPQPTTIGSRESGVRFDLSSFDRRPRLEKQEKSFSDPGPLSTLSEEDLSPMSEPRRGLFKNITDKISGQNSPKSPV
jgi:hypothetical protein